MSKTLQELKQAALDIKRSTAPESITAPQLGQLLDDIIEYAYTADESAINELKETVQGLVEKTGRNVVVFVAETNEGSGLSYGLGGGSEALRVMGSGGIRTFTGKTGNVPALIIDGSLIQTGASPEQISTAIKKWLDEHPEATTTVADGSITLVKLSTELQNAIKEGGTAIDSMSGGFILSEVAAGLKLALGLDLEKEDGTIITDWREDIIIPFATHLTGGAMSPQHVLAIENVQQDIEEVLKPDLQSAVQSAQNAERNVGELSRNFTSIEEALEGVSSETANAILISLLKNQLKSKIPTTEEDGFFVPDVNGNIGMKYDAQGLDFAELAPHAQDLLKEMFSNGNANGFINVKESGVYIIDNFGRIGADLTKGKFANKEEEKEYDFIVFAGQSNMAGRGVTSDEHPEGYPLITEGYEYNSSKSLNSITLAQEPFGTEMFSSTNATKQGTMIVSFMNAYFNSTGVPVIGMLSALGGTYISEWVEGGRCFANMRANINNAFMCFRNRNIKIRHKYIVWCQGEAEAEAGSGLDAEAYKSSLVSMFNSLKNSCGIEKLFVVRIGNRNPTDNASNAGKYKTMINLQTEICQQTEDIVMASCGFAGMLERGLMKDAFHYYQQAYNEVGNDAGRNVAFYVNTGIEPTMIDTETNQLYYSHKLR